jgi:ribosomal 50S subunit-associated protein YjgA (DUF615 family)
MYNPDEIKERPNKSQGKRDAAAINAFAQQLSRLTAKQYRQLDLPDEICDALNELTLIRNKAARNRHIKFVASLIRKSPLCAEIIAINLKQR